MHKHAEILKAIAEGKAIQWRNTNFHNEEQWQDLSKVVNPPGDVFSSLINGNENTSFRFRVKPEKKNGWINIYPDETTGENIYTTKDQADRNARAEVFACIEIEYEKGQGL